MPLLGTRGAASVRGFGLFSAPATVLDPFFPYVTMLLHGDGTNGAQNNTFLDSSTNNFSITRNGNTTQGSFSPYGSNWSNYFDGSGDYLTLANNSAFALPGDFTIELWAYFNSNTAAVFCGNINSSGYGDWAFFYNNAAGVRFLTDNSTTTITGAYTVTVGAWTHFAISRSGTSVKIFANGVLLSTTTNSSSNGFAGTMYIGRANDAGLQFPGYMSNLRIVKGTAVYTSAFTPSTTPLTAIANTSLLTCQSNRFIDNSTNNFAITRNGDVSVQRFSPFSPTAAYSTSVIGGSGYFDGSGDDLNIANNAAFNLSSGAWTVEAWIYPTTSAGYRTIISGRTAIWEMGLYTGTYQLYFYNGSIYTTTATVTPNSWNHVALSSNGTSIKIYINGVLDSTVTASPGTTGTAVTIGSMGSSQYFTGYIADARIVKGTQVYPSAFTPPTAPLTAITNTSLLTNFTNGGIFDNAMMNNLETVGDAQISTSVVKFGTGSLKFDGTGDYLSIPYNPNAKLPSGDWTIEFWLYCTTAQSYTNNGIWVQEDTGGYTGISISANSSRQVQFTSSSDGSSWTYLFQTIGTYTDNTWHHVAISKSGSTVRGFFNGTLNLTISSFPAVIYQTTDRSLIGKYSNSTFNGYIDDFRITKGYARYTSNFTPPTQAFPNQ